ncbi:deacetylase [Butyrivibrio sp. XB500-5]|uniref:deacetylase n=1 Tax=Butyrivibrio sp. XB500-5 TaxID=2364880 RepID=UPI000EAA42E7|nr:deacetylase [Butyrivibrio sp. XB500-5]RKM59522.1 deacetylase [Butyrivibrio sp. XB500-5]
MNRYFIITIDTEGDNLWGVKDIHAPITTKNASYLYRFQEQCEKYHFIPTYLTNYEMAIDPAMIELAREGLKNEKLEIGSHEHAWNSPPYYPLIKRPITRGKPFLGEYPRRVIRKKLEYLTKLLEDNFQTEVRSHRGGRWCFNSVILRELERLGYLVDCTCTPGMDWSDMPGWSIGSKGTDWSGYSLKEGFLSYTEKGKVKKSNIIEIPVTCIAKGRGKPAWFRPNGHNLQEMLGMLDYISERDYRYIEFMLHSSELMPGGSPTFERKGQIERLYEDLDCIFSEVEKKGFVGIGLTNYAKIIRGEAE